MLMDFSGLPPSTGGRANSMRRRRIFRRTIEIDPRSPRRLSRGCLHVPGNAQVRGGGTGSEPRNQPSPRMWRRTTIRRRSCTRCGTGTPPGRARCSMRPASVRWGNMTRSFLYFALMIDMLDGKYQQVIDRLESSRVKVIWIISTGMCRRSFCWPRLNDFRGRAEAARGHITKLPARFSNGRSRAP